MNEIEIFKKILRDAKKAVLQSKNEVVVQRENVQTRVDLVSQESIINSLKEHSVSCTLYSEELAAPLELNGGRYEIDLDPFDGSFLFLHGIYATTSIDMIVLEKRKVKYAFVQSMADDILYHCDETSAYLNGKKIICNINNASEPYLISGYAAPKKDLLRRVSAIANIPSDFYFLNGGGSLYSALVASNNLDAAMEIAPAPLHEFAGAMIAQKAGAFVETLEGTPVLLDPSVEQTLVVTRSEKLLREIQGALR